MPAKTNINYALYLIRQPQNLSQEILENIYKQLVPDKLIVSLETLFKGEKKAHVIYGPTVILGPLVEKLGLLELEDYSLQNNPVVAWEVGLKSSAKELSDLSTFKLPDPQIQENEQFWWQLVLQPVSYNFWGQVQNFFTGSSSKKLISQADSVVFQTVIRAVLLFGDRQRAESLQSELTQIGSNIGLAKLPIPYTSLQILKFYQGRASSQMLTEGSKKGMNIILPVSGVLALSGITND